MDSLVHRNINFATAAGLRDLLSSGERVDVRGHRVREIRNRLTVLSRPRERCLFLPHRGNDVIATLAETLWVVGGRDDIAWLSCYLPRAAQFSDDGRTWRAAYGPRLRNWNGVDQVAEIRRLLLEEAATRRAVMSLYDPDRDFVNSKDIPCNNWLHWLVREGQLHLTVGVRSNDLIWGFSGVNSFEWSVLQDMMAFWIGAEVGQATYLATSFHLYAHHTDRARRIVNHFRGVTCYDFGLTAPPFGTSFDQIDTLLSAWFSLEAEARADPNPPIDAERRLGDSFLAVALEMMRLHHGVNRGWRPQRLADELARLPGCDLAAAARELYGRRHPSVLDAIPNPQIADFIAAYKGEDGAVGCADIIDAIKRLHARKDAAYGTAWKRRGELTSILANVARKVDRLEHHGAMRTELPEEPVFDTAVDLFVYLLKYRLFLLERAPAPVAAPEFPDRSPPFSDDRAAFDASADRYAAFGAPKRSLDAITSDIVVSFERLHELAAGGVASVTQRLVAASRAAEVAFELILSLARERPNLVRAMA